MMSAQESRDQADKLLRSADDSLDYAHTCELERLAAEWRKLAFMAAWQEALTSALERAARGRL